MPSSAARVNELDEADIRDVLAWSGLILDDWQESLLFESLRQREDGRWNAFEVAGVVPRQNGKGAIMEARQLAGLFVFGERLQIHTAHEFKTCYEHFLRVKALVEGCDELLEQVRIIRTGAGDQSIELHTGERLRFLARSRSSIRGFSADTVYFDEAFELPVVTVGSVLPALSARPNPQVWYFSSAPHEFSEFLHSLLTRAESDSPGALLLRAWENEPTVSVDDVKAQRRVNPAFDVRIDAEFVENERRTLCATDAGVKEYLRERMGVREQLVSTNSPVDMVAWVDLAKPESRIAKDRTWSLAVSPDRRFACLSIAGRRQDGLYHVEYMDHRNGTGWVVPECVRIFASKGIPLRIHAQGAEASFIRELTELGVDIDEVPTAQVARATGDFIDAVNNRTLRHLGQEKLTRALDRVVLRTTETGGSIWAEKSTDADITTLKAVTVALGGVAKQSPPRIHVLQPQEV